MPLTGPPQATCHGPQARSIYIYTYYALHATYYVRTDYWVHATQVSEIFVAVEGSTTDHRPLATGYVVTTNYEPRTTHHAPFSKPRAFGRSLLQSKYVHLTLHLSRHLRPLFTQINVYFAADTEASTQVNAGFNGKRQAGDEGAGVVAFVVVQVGAAPWGRCAQVVPVRWST